MCNTLEDTCAAAAKRLIGIISRGRGIWVIGPIDTMKPQNAAAHCLAGAAHPAVLTLQGEG